MIDLHSHLLPAVDDGSRSVDQSVAVLREMARLKPLSVTALLDVRGVGARKAQDLGEAFVAVIASIS